MPDSLTPQTRNTFGLPIVFTPGAWQRAVLLEQSDHTEKLHVDRLSHVLRAALEAHQTYPHKPYLLFEVIPSKPTNHLAHEPLMQLSLSLLQEPGQPSALLIALVGEHQR